MGNGTLGIIGILLSAIAIGLAMLGVQIFYRRGFFGKVALSLVSFASLMVLVWVGLAVAKELATLTMTDQSEELTQEPELKATVAPVSILTPAPTPTNVCTGVPHSNPGHFPGADHRVKKGETLSSISTLYGTTVDALREANRQIHPEVYEFPDCLREGYWLIIPGLNSA